MIELLCSASIPCSDDQVFVTGMLAYNDDYVSVALNDTSVHVFLLLDGSYKLGFINSSREKLIWALALVDDVVITGSADGALSAWSIIQRCKISTIRSPNNNLIKYLLLLKSAPPSILAASSDGVIRQWVIGSPTYSREYTGPHSTTVFRMQSYDNESKFISIAWKGTVAAWNTTSGSAIWKFKQDIEYYSFAIGEAIVAVGRRDGIVKILKLEDGSEIASIEAHSKVVNGLVFYQNHLLTTGTDGFLNVFVASDSDGFYSLKKEIKLFDHAITARCIFKDRLVTAGKEGGGEENVCGLEKRIKTLKISLDGYEDVQVLELGLPVVAVWSVVAVESIGKIVSVVRRRGRPMLEIWGDSDMVL